jgi:hypothetical protein
MAYTKRETVKNLCKSIVTRLENRKAISFSPRLRQIVADEVYGLIGPAIMTDEDIREKAIARIGMKSDALNDSGVTDSDQFKTAKKMVREQMGDDELNGFYFQKPIRNLAQSISAYLMRSSNIDDVFETDAEIEHSVVDTVKNFRPEDQH